MRARLLALFRPRFSLRTLLVLMALVAVALAIWRWPWQEEHSGSWLVLHAPTPFRAMVVGPATRARVQYRRGWWAEHLKHGPAEAFDYEGRLVARQMWHDGEQHGPEVWYDSGGHVIVEQTWLHDTLTGPFRYGDGFSTIESGEHWLGQRHGKCTDQEQWFSRETIERVAMFERDVLHGECLWRSRTGEVLQRGRYEHGTLVEWNGEDLDLQGVYWHSFEIDRTQPLSIQIDPSLDRNRVPLDIPNDPESFPGGILTAVVPWGLTIEPRFGQLWIVRAGEVGLKSDPTGVSEVYPFPGTPLAAAWERPLFKRISNGDYYPRFGQLAPLAKLADAWPKKKELVLDFARHFPQLHSTLNGDAHRVELQQRSTVRAEATPLLLRDLVGSRLYQAGLQCELSRDRDRLVILPHWTTRRVTSGNP